MAWPMPQIQTQRPIPKGYGRTNKWEHRKLGSLEVSAIGLGCLPMVGYYGGNYEKRTWSP